ncbi:cation transporter [Rhodococcus rhodnii]|nr:cation transporter [Rhodococcus rhodnii]
MLLSIAAAIVTIGLKSIAAVVTGSVGFLSDALESGVNLVAAIVALIALFVAARPPDASHHFGHGKAEYFSAMVEGAMIFVAAVVIIWTAVQRIVTPQPLEQPGIGLALSGAAALVNLAMGITLQRVGRRERSITLVADGKHLMTDVWTTAGVLVGIALVAVTGWYVLDPIVALLVGVNILFTGYGLVRGSLVSLLDASLPKEDQAKVDAVLDRFRTDLPIEFDPPRTIESGRQRYVFVVAKVPGEWSVTRSHDVADDLEDAMGHALPRSRTFVHVEPAS